MILEIFEYSDRQYIYYEGYSFDLSNSVTMSNGKRYLRIDSYRILIVSPTDNPQYVDATISFNN